MTEDVRHRVDECDYVVRDDQFRFPQYVGSLKYAEIT